MSSIDAVKDEVVGAAELLATLLSGGASAVPSALSGLHGKLSGQGRADKIATDTMAKYTYAPRTAAGQRNLEAVGKAFEASKLPPVGVPGLGGAPRFNAADRAVVAGRALEPGPGRIAAQIGAVKAPGGHWAPSAQSLLADILTNGAEEGPLRQWADKAVPRYMSKHMGTDRDPLNRMQLTPDKTYEQATDRVLKRYAYRGDAADPPDPDLPTGIRPGEDFWAISNNRMMQHPELESKWRHAGDVAATIPPEDLMRMDLPQLMQYAERQTQRVAKREQLAYDPSMAEAGKRLTQGLRPEVEGSQGAWYRFNQSNSNSDTIRNQLSLDTAVNNMCVGGVCPPNSANPGIWKNRWIPSVDPRTGQVLPEAGDMGGKLTGYMRNVLKGKGDILSYRTPEGIPVATMETMKSKAMGQPRERVRGLLRAQPERGLYERWFKERAKIEGTRESQTWPLPGGGMGSPPRGMMSNADIKTIVDMYPQYREILTALMQEDPPHKLNQLKGFHNWGVAPKFNQDMVETLGRLNLEPRMHGDLTQSGLFLDAGQRGNMPLGNLKGWQEMLQQAGQGGESPLLLNAMGNAKNALKSTGSHVTKAEDAEALRQLGEILLNINAQMPRP